MKIIGFVYVGIAPVQTDAGPRYPALLLTAIERSCRIAKARFDAGKTFKDPLERSCLAIILWMLWLICAREMAHEKHYVDALEHRRLDLFRIKAKPLHSRIYVQCRPRSFLSFP